MFVAREELQYCAFFLPFSCSGKFCYHLKWFPFRVIIARLVFCQRTPRMISSSLLLLSFVQQNKFISIPRLQQTDLCCHVQLNNRCFCVKCGCRKHHPEGSSHSCPCIQLFQRINSISPFHLFQAGGFWPLIASVVLTGRQKHLLRAGQDSFLCR